MANMSLTYTVAAKPSVGAKEPNEQKHICEGDKVRSRKHNSVEKRLRYWKRMLHFCCEIQSSRIQVAIYPLALLRTA